MLADILAGTNPNQEVAITRVYKVYPVLAEAMHYKTIEDSELPPDFMNSEP